MARYATRIDDIPWGQDLTTSIALNGSGGHSPTAPPADTTLPSPPAAPAPPSAPAPSAPRPTTECRAHTEAVPPPGKFDAGRIVCTRQDLVLLVYFFLIAGLYFYARNLSARVTQQEQTIRVIVTALVTQSQK